MSNVLPHERKRAVWALYRSRFVLAGSLVALASAALSFLALLPSYIALHEGGPAFSASISGNQMSDEDRRAIAHTRDLLTVLSPLVSTTTTPTQALMLALSLRPAKVAVDHLNFTSGNPSIIMLGGSAGTREAINAYRQALAGDPHFLSASVPVGDLAAATGGRFSMTISGNF